MDYDQYERQQNAEIIPQEEIEDNGFEKIEDENDLQSQLLDYKTSMYFIFVIYSIILCILIFLKFKN